MKGLKKLKQSVAVFAATAMLFTGNTVTMYAGEVSAAKETAEIIGTDDPIVTETVSGSRNLKAEAQEPQESQSNKPYIIEINQGFSYHEKKDQDKDADTELQKNFVASKKTYIMVNLQAKKEEDAKKEVENWQLYYTAAGSDNAELTWKGEAFSFEQSYDKNSNDAGLMATVALETGPAAGKYDFCLKNGSDEIANRKDIHFYETNPLNILAVPVTSYYGQSNNVHYEEKEGGGCPESMVRQGVPCDEYWTNWYGKGKVTDLIKTYLSDVYPAAEINIEEGNVLDASDAKYDMCTDDGQKELWEEASKLQVKDRKTGKDKYDIILAFVMFRQDATGNGQGYTYGKPANIITLTDRDMLPTVAHEIAHCYEVGDEYDGGSYNYRVNDVPLEYKSNARDKVDSSPVDNSTKYMADHVSDFDKNKYQWITSQQYKNGLADGTTVYNGKSKDSINESGSGSVVYPSLHPFILSQGKFVHFADKGDEVFPTISYMGSGYSGDDNFYFTTSVIWDHLFNQFLKKEKKENQEGSVKIAADDEDDDVPDIYYDDECRFGESRMVEVSGELSYDAKNKEDNTAKGCDVDPMFSYDGDLETIDYLDLDGDDKGIKDENLFVFAAVDKDGHVITSPVDNEESIVGFSGSRVNTAVNVASNNGAVADDPRIQDFCEFAFDAEYPEGTDRFIIVQKDNYNKDTEYTKDNDETNNVLWSKDTPDNIIDGELLGVRQTDSNMSFEWKCAAYDADDKPTTSHLYTMIYFAPQGDDGDVYFVEDGYYDKGAGDDLGDHDFGAGKNGYASYSFNPKDVVPDGVTITDKAYAWIKVSDGVNGLDLYTDEASNQIKTDQIKMQEIVKANTDTLRTQVLGDTLPIEKNGKVFSIHGLESATGQQKVTINAKSKFQSDAFKNLDIKSAVTLSVNGTAQPAKTVKKLLKLNKKKGTIKLKPYKKAASYCFNITLNDGRCTLVLTVDNVGFNKQLKKTYLNDTTKSVSVNLIKMEGKKPLDSVSDFLSADWLIDKSKEALKPGETNKATSAGLQVSLSKDNRTLVVTNPNNKTKGSVKITAMVNGQKYSTVIKVKKK